MLSKKREQFMQADFDETVKDLEFATQKARLVHQIELKTRKAKNLQGSEKIKLEQEVILLQEQVKKLDEEKLKTLEDQTDW